MTSDASQKASTMIDTQVDDNRTRPGAGGRLPLWAGLTIIVLTGLILVLLGLLAM
jgi:hypothetical protein